MDELKIKKERNRMRNRRFLCNLRDATDCLIRLEKCNSCGELILYGRDPCLICGEGSDKIALPVLTVKGIISLIQESTDRIRLRMGSSDTTYLSSVDKINPLFVKDARVLLDNNDLLLALLEQARAKEGVM